MNRRTVSDLAPPLVLAVAMLLATALAKRAPHPSWTAGAGPLLLVIGLVGADLVQRRRSGRRLLPSPSVLLVAAAILVASAIVAAGDPARLAGAMPLLGSCAALPVILRPRDARASCRRD